MSAQPTLHEKLEELQAGHAQVTELEDARPVLGAVGVARRKGARGGLAHPRTAAARLHTARVEVRAVAEGGLARALAVVGVAC